MKNRYKVKPYGQSRWNIWDTKHKKWEMGGVGWGYRSEAASSCAALNENYRLHVKRDQEEAKLIASYKED